MPFKIVRTIENNKPQLCICPSQWEMSGLLQWPKKYGEKLIKDEYAIPKPDWRKINCVVKRKDLLSYESADKELQIMLDNTDTEQEDEPTQQVAFPHPQRRHPEPVNLNSLANQLVLQQSESQSILTAHTESGETYQIVVEDNPAKDPENITLKQILHNQSLLFELHNTLHENQKKIMHELASLSVQMEDSFSKISGRFNVKPLKECLGAAENQSFTIKQIKNVKDLEDMELLLSDEENKIKLINTSTFICSGGKGTAKNCAFRFVDVLFSRDFLCKCSWSGGSRSEGVKVSLKCYKNTLNFFYHMIRSWDDSYTLEDNEKFFKDILKNSNKRMNVKHERLSTKRRRTANKKDNSPMENNIEVLKNNIEEPRDSNDTAKPTHERGENEKDDDETEVEYLC